MYSSIKFMDGIDPVTPKERELATSEKKSHSARIAHLRRKAKREAQARAQHAGPLQIDHKQTLSRGHGELANITCSCSKSPGIDARYHASESKHVNRRPAKQHPSLTETESNTKSSSDLVPVVSAHRRLHSDAYLMFDNPEWLQTFDFWLNVSSPMTARYASPYGEVYTRIIPQFAMTSTTVRHMLLAHAYLHAKFLHGLSADADTLNSRAFFHYSRGVQAMCSEVSGTEFLAAAKLGYVFEAVQNNFNGARMHLKGYQAILSSYEGHRDENFQLLAASHDVANAITSIMTHRTPGKHQKDSRYKDHLTIPWRGIPFHTTEEARGIISTIFDNIGDGNSREDKTAIQNAKTSLSAWMDTIRSWDIEQAPSVKRSVLLLLFNLATALLPVSHIGKLNYTANPLLIEYIFKSADSYFDQRHKETLDDRTDILKTLAMLAHYTIKLIDILEYQERASSLLSRIENIQPHTMISSANLKQISGSASGPDTT